MPKLIDPIRLVLPGVLVCVAVTLAATALQGVEVHFAGQPYLEALVLAILIGVALRTLWTPGPRWQPGIDFSAKFVLEVAIVMLGAAVSVGTIVALGPLLIVGIAAIVVVAIGVSYLICRALGLPQRMSILIACGNSICGNSAIAAVAPVIGADGDDVASSISFTAVLGVVVVLTLPLLVPILQSVADAIWRAGRAHRLRRAAGAGRDAADRRLEQPGRHRHQAGARVDARPRRARLLAVLRTAAPRAGQQPTPARGCTEFVPWFIVGFLVVLVARSLELIPAAVLPGITRTASVFTTIAMAALGLGVDVRAVARTGVRVTLAVIVSLIFLGLLSYALIHFSGIA